MPKATTQRHRTLGLILLACYLPTLVWAAPGFQPLDQGLGFPLDAVVKIYFFSAAADTIIPKSEVAEARATLFERFNPALACAYMLSFERPMPDGSVHLSHKITGATGLVLGDSRTVISNHHVIHLDDDGTARGFIMVDRNGHILVDTRFDKSKFKVVPFEDSDGLAGSELLRLPKNARSEALDGVALILEMPLPVPGVKAFKDHLPKGSQVSLLSYPAPTSDRFKLYGASDSDGRSLSVSHGKVNRIGPWYLKRIRAEVPQKALRKAHYASLIFADVDAMPGASGAPLIDQNGNLVGLLCSKIRWSLNEPEEYSNFGVFGIRAALIDRALPGHLRPVD